MTSKPRLRCAIYTRKSSEEGLEQDFNSLDAQREACEAYVRSQVELGWVALKDNYDDGGFSGGTLERPALTRLMADIQNRKVDIIVLYKIDRLTRSLTDFAKLAEQFDAHGVSFVSVTQQFNTTTSMGRLMLNVLLSFAQFEREVTGERIRDKIAASKRKGMWMGGTVPLGYTAKDRTLVINEAEAPMVRTIFQLYLELGCVRKVVAEVRARGFKTRFRPTSPKGRQGGIPMGAGHLYLVLQNPAYVGMIRHREQVYPANHPAIIDQETWDRVQAQIAANRQGHRRRVTAHEPSLLAGLLYDGEGKRYVPTHSLKKGRRYRYYVHESVTQPGSDTRGKRLPAQEVEAVVQRAIRNLLSDHAQLLSFLGGSLPARVAPGLLAAAGKRLVEMDAWTPSCWCAALLSVLERAELLSDRISIHLKSNGFAKFLGQSVDALDHTLMIQLPVKISARGIQLRLILPRSDQNPARHDGVLIRLLCRALSWRELLETGSMTSLRDLAIAESLSEAFIGRVLQLAYLPPRFVADISEGRQPANISAQKLMYGRTS